MGFSRKIDPGCLSSGRMGRYKRRRLILFKMHHTSGWLDPIVTGKESPERPARRARTRGGVGAVRGCICRDFLNICSRLQMRYCLLSFWLWIFEARLHWRLEARSRDSVEKLYILRGTEKVGYTRYGLVRIELISLPLCLFKFSFLKSYILFPLCMFLISGGQYGLH